MQSMEDNRRRARSGTTRRPACTSPPRRAEGPGRCHRRSRRHRSAPPRGCRRRRGRDLRDHLVGRRRTRVSAPERDDAEGAAVVAAVLDLHERAVRPAFAVIRVGAAGSRALTKRDAGLARPAARSQTPVASSRRLSTRRRPRAWPRRWRVQLRRAQPVTTSGRRALRCAADGLARLAYASAVTAQVLTTRGRVPGGAAGTRMASTRRRSAGSRR